MHQYTEIVFLFKTIVIEHFNYLIIMNNRLTVNVFGNKIK